MKLATCITLAGMLATTPAFASQEQIHSWKQLTLVVDAGSLGDAEIHAAADARGHVTALAIKLAGSTFTVPATMLAKLGPLAIGSVEVRTEAGYDADPWLYVVFHVDFPSAKAARDDGTARIAVHAGKLGDATVSRTTAGGDLQTTTVKAP